MSLQAETEEMPPKKEPLLGQNTPVALGVVLALFSAVIAFGYTAGSLNKSLDGALIKSEAIERREVNGAKSQIEIASRLSRIEALLEDIRRR